MSRIRRSLSISESDRKELELWSRSQTIERRLADRARIILLSDGGKTFEDICSELNTSPPVVNKWRNRYRARGINGLKDQPRSGKPTSIDAATRAEVLELATNKPEDGYTSWSQRRIAQHLNISQNSVTRILQEADQIQHKIQYGCGKSTDP